MNWHTNIYRLLNCILVSQISIPCLEGADTFPAVQFTDLCSMSGTVYAATSGGLMEFEPDGRFRRVWTEKDGLPSSRINSLTCASDNTLWIATAGGVSSLTNGQLRSYTDSDGLNDICVYCVGEGPNGALYAGTHRGVSLWNGRNFEPFDDTHEFGRRPTYDIHWARDGSLWFAKATSLTRYTADGLWQTFQKEPLELRRGSQLVSNSIRDVESDPEGRVWIATEGGLGLYSEGRWTEWLYRERLSRGRGLLDNRLVSIAYDADGWLWLAYGATRDFDKPLGVTRFNGTQWEHLTTDDGLPSGCVNRIRTAADGNVWIATDAGGCVWKGRVVTVYRAPGL